jgi:2-oxoisovalerate dehydrogenase E1 component alpha subunit
MDSLAAPVVARFEIGHTRFVDEEGRVCAPLPAFAEDAAQLRSMYRTMLLARALDKKAVALQRTGQLGTYASSLGQEAIGTAMGLALAADDVLIPAYREYPAQFLRGVPLHSIMAYWAGDERAMAYPAGVPAQHDFPLSVPIGTHVPQAIGVAYAFRLRKQARVVMTSCGDGATSKGDFYEAVSSARVWNLPIVFVVSNNQWAISLPRERQTGAETLAQKGIAGGLPSEQVDGNDVIATRFVLERAIERARGGGGPSLVEAITYRLHDHTTADDARRYRSEEEVKQAWERCPIKRLKRLLEKTAHGWNTADEAALQADCVAQAEAAAQTFLAMPPQAATAIIDHLYAELPRALRWQREELRQAGELA